MVIGGVGAAVKPFAKLRRWKVGVRVEKEGEKNYMIPVPNSIQPLSGECPDPTRLTFIYVFRFKVVFNEPNIFIMQFSWPIKGVGVS